MLFKSYPHTNHKAIKFVKLRVSMWIIRRKNFFNFSLLPVARLNCYEKLKQFMVDIRGMIWYYIIAVGSNSLFAEVSELADEQD